MNSYSLILYSTTDVVIGKLIASYILNHLFQLCVKVNNQKDLFDCHHPLSTLVSLLKNMFVYASWE